MVEFGGMGGIPGGRPVNNEDLFELTVAEALGDSMKVNDNLCAEIWSAIANVQWRHVNGDTASYSFRAAGDLIAAIIERGDYIDWYCSGPYATVSDRVGAALAARGWSHSEMAG